MNYIFHIIVLINIYIILAVSLNLLAGYTGLISLCSAAFCGIGGYATAILSLRYSWSWLPTILLGGALAGLCAIGIALASLRFRNDYFVIATFAFQVIIYSVMLNWVKLTEGPLGIPGIPNPIILGFPITKRWHYAILSLLIAVLVIFIIRRLVISPYGRILQAIREDEIFVCSLGKNVSKFKISAFTIGAIFSAIAGSIYASYITYIDPNSFSVHESIFILSIVIFGGLSNIWGSVIGAAFLVSIPEALRFIGLSSNIASNVQLIIFALFLVIFMILRPQGLIGKFDIGKSRRL